MRLPTFARPPLWRQRAFLTVTRWAGAEVDDVGKVAMRRPDFGRPFLALVDDVLRGTSGWSVGERELLAAVVSSANACSFCVGTHGQIADTLLGDHLGWEDGRFGPRVTAAAHLADALTRGTGQASHVVAARAAGCTQTDLEDVVDIVFAFYVINKLADALGFSYRSERDRRRGAAVLRRNGYRLPALLLPD